MKQFDWRDWSPWTTFLFIDAVAPIRPGCYVIGIQKPISRMVGIDDDGILAIGESDNLSRRLNQFYQTITGANSHSAGRRFYSLQLQQYFPPADLRVRWQSTQSKHDALRLEAMTHLAYLHEHREMPPLNYSLNTVLKTLLDTSTIDANTIG